MKKSVLIFGMIVLIIIAILLVKYFAYKNEYNAVLKENHEFQQYKDKEIYGIQLGTIINKAIDKNTKNDILKDENGLFISNNENSIQIEIYMTDNEQVYKMETFYNAGLGQFIQYYNNVKFKCSKIEYHKETGKIKYIYFEQIQTS